MTSDSGVSPTFLSPLVPQTSVSLISRKEAICRKILEHSNNINNPQLQADAYCDKVGPQGEEKVQSKSKRFFKGFTFGFTHFYEKTFSAEKMGKFKRGGFAALAVGSFLLSLSNAALGFPGLLSAAIYCGLTKIGDDSLKKQDSKDHAEMIMQELHKSLETSFAGNPTSPYKPKTDDTSHIVDEKFTKEELLDIKMNLEDFTKKIKKGHYELTNSESMKKIETHITILSEAIKQIDVKEAEKAYQNLASKIINDLYKSPVRDLSNEDIALRFNEICGDIRFTKKDLLLLQTTLFVFISKHEDLKDTPFFKHIQVQMEKLQHAAMERPTILAIG